MLTIKWLATSISLALVSWVFPEFRTSDRDTLDDSSHPLLKYLLSIIIITHSCIDSVQLMKMVESKNQQLWTREENYTLKLNEQRLIIEDFQRKYQNTNVNGNDAIVK